MANIHTGQQSTYSFLIHASSSSSQDAPPNFEGSGLKQKRRRTSPRDHAILEAAYLKNSKPDKNERAEIVSQVELGEKEVQIWFQNRRQNDRRKSRPLQHHELLARIRNGAPTHSPPKPNSVHDSSDSRLGAGLATKMLSTTIDIQRPSSRSSSIHELLNPPSSADSASTQVHGTSSSQRAEPFSTPASSYEQAGESTEAPAGAHQNANQISSESAHSRKRSHEVMTEPSVSTNTTSNILHPVILSKPPLTKQSSFVRLAMTIDGAVKVRTNNETTPSPPKQRLPPPNALARRNSGPDKNQSTTEGNFEFKDINPTIRRAGGAGFGRSRDVRTWEFYCDRDSGDALSTQVEAERNGSAIGAINLIRSHSQRNKVHALSPNLAKQNKKHVIAGHGDKPKLSRARSSMARLQSFDGALDLPENNAKRARHTRSSSGDSDKENWAPGTRASHNPLRRMNPSAPRSSILQESDVRPLRTRTRDSDGQRQEDGGSVVKQKTKVEDLDCIQGLLSLSQGAWR